MLKRVLLILSILLLSTSAFAADNYLNSVVLEKNADDVNIIFRSDNLAKVKKDVLSDDRVELTLKGISQSPSINTLYKGISDVNGLIIENIDANDLKVYISAPNISKSNIIFETPNSAPVVVNDTIQEGRILWGFIAIALLFFVLNSAKKITTKELEYDFNKDLKEREKALYRNFQREVATLPSMNYKLKGYRKHVLKGETIRSYENRLKV